MSAEAIRIVPGSALAGTRHRGQVVRPVAGVLADGTAFYAPAGEVVTDGVLVVCHLCGRSLRSVSAHLRVHGWSAGGYREAFGLERRQPLEGLDTRKLRAAALTSRLLFEPAVREGSAAGRERARTGHLAAVGRPTWEPTPAMPAVVIVIAEYAELADKAPAALDDTGFIAGRGRAAAVTLIAATLRPAHKALGQDAVRSQMDTRICFRVRERKDVDLVLGPGMLRAGWHAHTLDAPRKFLISAPEYTTPKRACAYLVTGEDVARAVARFGPHRPQLDDMSRSALNGWGR